MSLRSFPNPINRFLSLSKLYEITNILRCHADALTMAKHILHG